MALATVSTWYGDINETLFERMKAIKLVICDVDGVFSDGRIYLGNSGEELKAFHTRDGFGVKALLNNGIRVAVVTGRQSQIVEQRMQALGVQDIVQGTTEKLAVYQRLAEKYQLENAQIASIGDDVPDVVMLQHAGLGVAPQDAHPWVQQQADYVTSMRGGFGAVRELSDLILLSQGHLQLHGGVSL
ncbi:3-deoxy-manno-octulosonate-8-phosphatase KdsC [Pseudidiomarina halophila]|uniref:3-deoxy-D-manno-octulosonate 8-phosphate phosphatase KdsC n=1 Tax=Pseudidiomarina halophila TaxID=1449799 RepID=A0A432XWN2_9GAMM|nr:3-deoxy-manno-octulosonate-8-phosphatase KdsC [Pseudidiomarina halophila]RUO53001.1 3-deoxy-manno-octulosonate-8-phosphatase KdsC [Pseudidiomarina halophila]